MTRSGVSACVASGSPWFDFESFDDPAGVIGANSVQVFAVDEDTSQVPTEVAYHANGVTLVTCVLAETTGSVRLYRAGWCWASASSHSAGNCPKRV